MLYIQFRIRQCFSPIHLLGSTIRARAEARKRKEEAARLQAGGKGKPQNGALRARVVAAPAESTLAVEYGSQIRGQTGIYIKPMHSSTFRISSVFSTGYEGPVSRPRRVLTYHAWHCRGWRCSLFLSLWKLGVETSIRQPYIRILLGSAIIKSCCTFSQPTGAVAAAAGAEEEKGRLEREEAAYYERLAADAEQARTLKRLLCETRKARRKYIYRVYISSSNPNSVFVSVFRPYFHTLREVNISQRLNAHIHGAGCNGWFAACSLQLTKSYDCCGFNVSVDVHG